MERTLSDTENSTEGTEIRKVGITNLEVEGLCDLVGANQMEVPNPQIVRVIAEATEALLRRQLNQLKRPVATHLEIPGGEEAEAELVIPLLGTPEERRELIKQIVCILIPVEGAHDGLAAAAQLAEESLKLTLEYGILPELAERLIRLALAETKRPDADGFLTKYECGHEVVWLGAVQDTCPHDDGDCGEARTTYSQIMVGGWLEAAFMLGARD